MVVADVPYAARFDVTRPRTEGPSRELHWRELALIISGSSHARIVVSRSAHRLPFQLRARDARPFIRGAIMMKSLPLKCEVDGASQAGLTGLGIMEIKVLVRAEDFDRAKSYVEKHEHWHVPSPAAD